MDRLWRWLAAPRVPQIPTTHRAATRLPNDTRAQSIRALLPSITTGIGRQAIAGEAAVRSPRNQDTLHSRPPQAPETATERVPPQPAQPPTTGIAETLKRICERRDDIVKRQIPQLGEKRKLLRVLNDEVEFQAAEEARRHGTAALAGSTQNDIDGLVEKRNEAEKALTEARKACQSELDRQSTDRDLYRSHMQRRIIPNGLHAVERDLRPSVGTTDALQTVFAAEDELSKQRTMLADLQTRLNDVRREARARMRRAGLHFYEQRVRSLKQQIADTRHRLEATHADGKNALNAFYTGAAMDLLDFQSKNAISGSDSQRSDVGQSSEELKDSYERAIARLLERRPQHDAFRDTYDQKLQAYLADAKDDATNSRTRSQFDTKWFEDWCKVTQVLNTIENALIERRDLFMKAGGEPLDIDHLCIDMPEFAGEHPEDGRVDCMSPEVIEALRQQSIRNRPAIESWMGRVPDEENEDGRRPWEQQSLDEGPGDALQPWESISQAERRPRKRARIDEYQLVHTYL